MEYVAQRVGVRRDPNPAPLGGGPVPQPLQGSGVLWRPEAGAGWPAGDHLLGEDPKVDPALLTTFIFSKIKASGINLMLKCTQAAYFAPTILQHMSYMPPGIKCAVFCFHMVQYFLAYTSVPRPHGQVEGAWQNIQTPKGRCMRGTQAGPVFVFILLLPTHSCQTQVISGL